MSEMIENSHTLGCKILQVSDIISRGKDGNFKMRYILVETDEGDYSQKIKMECSGKNVDEVTEDWMGKNAVVQFNLNGFEWQEKNYVSLRVWKAELTDGAVAEAQPSVAASEGGESGNNLPF